MYDFVYRECIDRDLKANCMWSNYRGKQVMSDEQMKVTAAKKRLMTLLENLV